MTCTHCSSPAVWEVASVQTPWQGEGDWTPACDRHVGKVIDSFPRKQGALARGIVVGM